MTKVGRNDPCPCGSGKKYKKCCADEPRFSQVPPEVIAAQLIHERDQRLVEDVLSWAETAFGGAAIDEALEPYDEFGDADVIAAEAPLEDAWLAYCHQNDDGRTLAGLYLEAKGQLPEADEHLLLRQLNAPLSIFQVVRVSPKRSVEVVDRLTLDQHTVTDLALSQVLVQHDFILGRVVTLREMSVFSGVHPRLLSPEIGEQIVTHVRKRLSARKGRRVPYAKVEDPENQLFLLYDWRAGVEAVDNAPLPQLCNTDGHDLLTTRDHFELDPGERDQVLRALLAIEGADLETDAKGPKARVSFVRAGNAVHKSWQNTVVGFAELDASRLVLESNSVERADQLRDLVTRAVGSRILHRLRDHEDPTVAMAGARAGMGTGQRSGRGARDTLPPEAEAVLRQMREEYMKGWIDLELPALDGLTARQAARSQEGRQRVELLLRGMENMEARRPAAERLDFTGLRAELGLG